MTLMKIDQKLFPNLANLWEDFLGKDVMEGNRWKNGYSIPAVNILEQADKYLVHLAIPGMKKENFKIQVDNGVLSISSENEERKEIKNEEGKYTRREFSYESFNRSFSLPESVETENIQAKYENGILEISLPKHTPVKKEATKKISVS